MGTSWLVCDADGACHLIPRFPFATLVAAVPLVRCLPPDVSGELARVGFSPVMGVSPDGGPCVVNVDVVALLHTAPLPQPCQKLICSNCDEGGVTGDGCLLHGAHSVVGAVGGGRAIEGGERRSGTDRTPDFQTPTDSLLTMVSHMQ